MYFLRKRYSTTAANEMYTYVGSGIENYMLYCNQMVFRKKNLPLLTFDSKKEGGGGGGGGGGAAGEM